MVPSGHLVTFGIVNKRQFLASAFRLSQSIVRHAMVEIMMEAVAPRQNFQNRYPSFGNGGLAMGEEAPEGAAVGTRLAEGEEEGWGRTLFCRDVPDNPAKCMMWCAIALGALMRGSPVEFVSRR